MSKKIEVKVNMHCEKCRTDVLKSVTKISGIDQVTVDLEKKMLIVVGGVDPVSVAERVKKTGKRAKIVTVGRPSKKPDPPACVPDPPICESIIRGYPYPVCTNVYPVVVVYPQPCDYETGGCVIL